MAQIDSLQVDLYSIGSGSQQDVAHLVNTNLRVVAFLVLLLIIPLWFLELPAVLPAWLQLSAR